MNDKAKTWRCMYGHRHAGQRDPAGCPDYIEKVWRPAGVVEEEMARIQHEAKQKISAAKRARDKAIRTLLRKQPTDVLLYLTSERGRELSPEEAEVVRRLASGKHSEGT